MKDFKKLNKEEMKKIGGGTGGPCPTGRLCSFYDGFQPINGNCGVVNGICNCISGNLFSGSVDCN